MALRDLVAMNDACLMKSCWEVRHGSQGLWIDVLKGKYGGSQRGCEGTIAKSFDSSFWKQVVRLWHQTDDHEFWVLGNGERVLCGMMLGLHQVLGFVIYMVIHVPQDLKAMRVCDMVLAENTWDIYVLQPHLPDSVLSKIFYILTPSKDCGLDNCLWATTKDGMFSVSFAYLFLQGVQQSRTDTIWSKIWHLEVPKRMGSFLWLLKHDRLLTNKRKHRLGLGQPYCHHCCSVIETTLHMLRDCLYAIMVWQHLLGISDRSAFFFSDLHQWVEQNLSQNFARGDGYEWRVIWGITCHLLWKWRNNKQHDSSFVRPL